MAVTVDTITKRLTSRNFPMRLIQAGLQEILDTALEEMNNYSPITTYAIFDTVADQQDYKIFDPDDAVLAGFAANASFIKEVYWNPAGDFSSLNIFSPGWYTVNQVLLFTGGYFHQMSQMMILRQELNAWHDQFGSQGYEIIGPVGAAGSVLRLFPTPQDSSIKVVVEFGTPTTLELIADSQVGDLMDWVYYYAAEAIANKYATTAGIDLLGFADSTAAMKYWAGKAEGYNKSCMDNQSGPHGAVARS
jgi:hypothetical protein